jgi:ubiquinol-cytochrome c reductase iron-sulfur subunit
MGPNWPGGFLCPCHGSKFDLAGRVYANMPAPENLPVPRYAFLSDTKLIIGDDTKGA